MKKTVAQKMRIKNNCRAFLVDAPKEAIDSLELPERLTSRKYYLDNTLLVNE